VARENGGSAGDEALVIRPARPTDDAAVMREMTAYLRSLDLALDAADLDHDVAAWQRDYDGTSGVLLVVERPDGTIVGTAAIRLLAPDVGELKRMWLRPQCRGVGVGRRLIEACMAEAHRLGCRRLVLDSQRRLAAALALYRAYGFQETSDYNGNPRADVWMERAL
jgi:GNAT superfamily N-acetyltransferase